ncbi:MAG: tRNA (guanosine(46)-N7)-methyltransferase TrmB [Deltaproteobacteria bacterium]|nr:tRNA (guanosine(46)-N7)-methyltransferase TrmB [Deltaproteobacteria bacterium]
MERVRKHANPFSVRVELGRLDRIALFGREGLVEIELGSGAGGFLTERARKNPGIDFIGFEIRRPLVARAEELRKALECNNLVFLFANGGAVLDGLLPAGSVSRFHVHFPDPCPKKRHHKRRLLNPTIVRRIATLLRVGGDIYAQSDVRELSLEMASFIEADGSFAPRLLPLEGGARPVEERTEWERHHESRSEPIYRLVYEKIREPEGAVPTIPFRRISIP